MSVISTESAERKAQNAEYKGRNASRMGVGKLRV